MLVTTKEDIDEGCLGKISPIDLDPLTAPECVAVLRKMKLFGKFAGSKDVADNDPVFLLWCSGKEQKDKANGKQRKRLTHEYLEEVWTEKSLVRDDIDVFQFWRFVVVGAASGAYVACVLWGRCR